jgi:6-phosphogluconolactonase (cycloisomerase 2 family)
LASINSDHRTGTLKQFFNIAASGPSERSSLYRYASSWRILLVAIGIVLALTGTGCSSSPAIRFAYVATDQGIFAFRMNSKTGEGSTIFGSPFVTKIGPTTAASPSSVVVHPSNNFLYAANQNTSTLSLFKINSTTGALDEVLPRTALVTSSGGVGLSPAVMTMDSGGKYLFVGNQTTNDIWVYSIGSSGALTFVSSAQVGASPASLTLSASDGFLYVPVPTFSAVYVFSVSAGVLTQVGAPLIVNGGVGHLGTDSAGKFLYVPNPSLNTVTVLLIQADGSLLPGPGLFATGTSPVAAATNSTGAFLYVANSASTNLSQFKVDTTTGTLTALTTSVAGTGTNPESIVVDPDAKFIFVINQQSNSITEFTINKDGTLATTGNALQLSVSPRDLSLTR